MKCATFCLLAFYAFKIVFADQFKRDLDKLRSESDDQVNYIIGVIRFTIETEMDAAEAKGINIGSHKYGYGCYGAFDAVFDRYLDLEGKQLDKCFDKATKTKNIEPAKTCSEKAITELGKGAKKAHAVAKACIAKCAHTDCTKLKVKQYADIPNLQE